MRIIGTIAFLIAALWGCQATERVVHQKPPEVRALLGCTAGAISDYKVSGTLESDLDKAISQKKLNLSSSFEVNDWVKGYIFEKVPATDALEAYKLYMGCYEREMKRLNAGIDTELVPFVSRTEDLWKRWDEAVKYGYTVDVLVAEDYALEAKRLSSIDGNVLDHKNNILKYDREALMYFLAGEIIARQPVKSNAYETMDQALEYSHKCIKAALAAREWYRKILEHDFSQQEKDWIVREEISLVTSDRLAECYAQSIFLGDDAAHDNLSEVLSKLPCSYIAKYKLSENIVYKRIGTPREIMNC